MILNPDEMAEEYEGKWCVELMDCDLCERSFVYVYPICCERIECLGCGAWNATAPIPEEELNV